MTVLADGERQSLLMNFDWKFKLGETVGAEQRDFDDTSWRSLDLPLDFQIEMPWNEKASRSRGFKDMATAWYRKTFNADKGWQGKRVILDFEGIMLHGDAYLNGTKIGGTDYGYLGFVADVTRLIDYDRPNVLAVHCSTGKAENSRWYTGGGLYRDVHLTLKDSVAIARHGIFIQTPDVSQQQATVDVQVEVEGIRNKKYDLVIATRILDPDGQQVGETRVNAPKDNKQPTVEVKLPQVTLQNPKLWWTEQPDLYTAEVSLILNGKTVDKLSERFGIRKIEFSKDFGLKLNGKKLFLKGAADHQDYGAVGVAAYETSIARMMDKLKAFGFNHIRTSHNPLQRVVPEACRREGKPPGRDNVELKQRAAVSGGAVRIPHTRLGRDNLQDYEHTRKTLRPNTQDNRGDVSGKGQRNSEAQQGVQNGGEYRSTGTGSGDGGVELQLLLERLSEIP